MSEQQVRDLGHAASSQDNVGVQSHGPDDQPDAAEQAGHVALTGHDATTISNDASTDLLTTIHPIHIETFNPDQEYVTRERVEEIIKAEIQLYKEELAKEELAEIVALAWLEKLEGEADGIQRQINTLFRCTMGHTGMTLNEFQLLMEGAASVDARAAGMQELGERLDKVQRQHYNLQSQINTIFQHTMGHTGLTMDTDGNLWDAEGNLWNNYPN